MLEISSVKTPLKGKYLIQNRLANQILGWIDSLLSALPKTAATIPASPKSIVVSNIAHMGDVLLMTSLLKVLRQQFPQARLGVLVGSWALPIIENHPCVDKIHVIDHWKLNRSSVSWFRKIFRYYTTKRRALKEIRDLHYEVAIDSYYYFPNAVPFFWQAKVATRIGYVTAGFGPLLTHPLTWSHLDQPVVHYYIALLEQLGIAPSQSAPFLKPNLASVARRSGTSYLLHKHKCDLSQGYAVVHIGTGSPMREWPIEDWRKLAMKMEGYPLVFTGKGVAEREKIEKVISGIRGCVNLGDVLKWEEFLAILQDAYLLVGVESVAGHLAAAFDIPAVLIYSGMTSPSQWAPMNKRCKIITHPVPCAPCYRSQGCPLMSCVRKVSVDEVHRACRDFLPIL